MSELGPLAFGKKEEAIFLGREIAQHRDYSEDTAIHIDAEVRKIVTSAYETARNICSTTAKTSSASRWLARARSSRRHRTETAHGRQAAAGEGPARSTAAALAAVPGVEPKPAPRPELRPAPGFSKG